jgi:hypothetical protein
MGQQYKWIIVLIAFDDPGIAAEVIKDRIDAAEDERLAAFLRGGELLNVLHQDDETMAEGMRRDAEKECLR